MNPFLFFLLGCLISIPQIGCAQGVKNPRKHLDTLYANEHKTVALFFPSPIRQAITGAPHFVFTYNREQQQYFGLLQAQPGTESNLLVVSADGQVYSYILRYREHLKQLHYFINLDTSIGSKQPTVPESLSKVKSKTIKNPDTTYYQKFCSYLLKRKQQLGRIQKKRHGIRLQVQNIVFDTEALYFVVAITNSSSLDYDVSLLEFSVQTRKKGKRTSMQRLIKEPVFNYHIPDRISKHSSKRMVVVFPKFSISNDKRVLVTLQEKKGERNLTLDIPHRFINNPN